MQTASRVYARSSHLTSAARARINSHLNTSLSPSPLPLSCLLLQVRLDSLSLNLSDSALWMAMDTNLLQSVTPLPTP